MEFNDVLTRRYDGKNGADVDAAIVATLWVGSFGYPAAESKRNGYAMKRLLSVILAMVIGLLSAQAQHFYGLSVRSYRISSAWPTSFRSVKGSVTAVIGNTGDTRSMRGITATVYRNGKRFASGICEDVVLLSGTREYVFRGQVSLAEGVSTWDAILAAFSFDASEYTIDFTVDIGHPDGRTDHVVRAGRPLRQYLGRL